jgi:hypothetical protein
MADWQLGRFAHSVLMQRIADYPAPGAVEAAETRAVS